MHFSQTSPEQSPSLFPTKVWKANVPSSGVSKRQHRDRIIYLFANDIVAAIDKLASIKGWCSLDGRGPSISEVQNPADLGKLRSDIERSFPSGFNRIIQDGYFYAR